MKRLHDEEYWDVVVRWTKPRPYSKIIQDGCFHDDNANLYSILARYSSAARKSIYVGKTYKQYVSKRLTQYDHVKRYKEFCTKYSKHTFEVSYGHIQLDSGKLTSKRVGEIEQLLIYASNTDHSQNVKNYYDHKVKDCYRITNTGYRNTLPKTIHFGVFVSK